MEIEKTSDKTLDMTKWLCKCGADFQTRETFVAECPRCAEIVYCLPTCGNFIGFRRKIENKV